MLTPSQLENAAREISDVYEELHTEMLKKIARDMRKNLKHVSDPMKYSIERAQEAGLMREQIAEYLQKVGVMAEAEAIDVMKQAGIESVKYDEKVYEQAGLMTAPKDFVMSPAMAQILASGINKNMGRLKNITRSAVSNSPELYAKYMDLAYSQITSGAYTYEEALKNATSLLADEGLTVANYASGRKVNMESAVRTAVLTGVNQTAAQLQLQRASEVGADLVETTAHMGARPSHQLWQGKVFSISGTHPKYPKFDTNTGYGTVDGLCGANCRHNFFPFIEGFSIEAYSTKELRDLQTEKVTYTDSEGLSHTVSKYEGTQKLRYLERGVKQWKRKAEVTTSAGLDASFENSKVREWQKRARKFTAETGIKRDYFRERITKTATSKPSTPKAKLMAQPVKPKRTYNTEHESHTEQWEKARLKYREDMDVYKVEKEKWMDEMLDRPTPFKTHAEARDWFSTLGVETLGDFDEIDLKAFTDIKQAYEDMYSKYPALKYNAREFTVNTAREGTHIAEFNFGVHFNKGELKDYRAWLTSFDGMYNAGSSVYDIVVHELGHGLDDLFTFEKGRWDVSKMDMNHAFDPRKTVSKEMLKDNIVGNAIKGMSTEGITDAISDYATTNRGELFAEVITRKFESKYKKSSASSVVETISSGVDDLLKTSESWVDVEYLDAIAKVRRKNR